MVILDHAKGIGQVVIHIDGLYLQRFVRLEGAVGLAVYAITILAVAGVLYLCVERPFLQLRERTISSLRETTSVSKWRLGQKGNFGRGEAESTQNLL
jgi:hypothetical protein